MKINTYAVNCNDAWLNTEGDDISGSYVKHKDHQDVVAALEAKCAALAAENAALKQFPEQIIGFIGRLGTSEIGRSTRERIESAARRIKTPATDAFLAEVRAQGVEMLLSYLPPYYTARADIENFAAQLRQEAAQ